MMEVMERRVAVRGIIFENGKLFCVRHKFYHGALPGISKYWAIPGGGVDPHEPLHEAIHREMVEETGIIPDIGNLLYVQQFTHEDREFLEFFFHIKNTRDYEKIDLAATTHGQNEIEEFGFIDPKTAPIRPTLLAEEDIAVHIVENRPTKLFSYI